MYNFRVANLNLNKELTVALNCVYGLGWHKGLFILSRLGIPYLFFVDDLNTYYKDALFFYLEPYVVSVARIDRYVSLSIKKLVDLSTYKGIRHTLHLPVHGQRTRTNASTQRTKRRNLEKLKKLDERSRRNFKS